MQPQKPQPSAERPTTASPGPLSVTSSGTSQEIEYESPESVGAFAARAARAAMRCICPRQSSESSRIGPSPGSSPERSLSSGTESAFIFVSSISITLP
ncbi:MAG: hypothetical protein BWX47_02162 [candidate division Hyd24-12 bacterium ADurb.Bin004]|nr:MAG: hypothetical protein BWX47_02162 [candidate division Hyd24-12 bacterium ADurb.Bin004]